MSPPNVRKRPLSVGSGPLKRATKPDGREAIPMAFHPRYLRGAQEIGVVAEAVRYRRPHIPDAVRERSVVVIQVPNIDRTDYEKKNNEHSHVISPLLRVRGKFVVALPRGACLWTTPLDENERVQPIHWPVTAMLPIVYKDLTNGFRLRRSVRWLLFFCPRKSWRGYRPEDRNGGLAAEVLRPGNGSRSRAWSAKPQHGNSGENKTTALPIPTLHEDLAGLFWQRNSMFVATARRCRNAGVQQPEGSHRCVPKWRSEGATPPMPIGPLSSGYLERPGSQICQYLTA